MNSVLSTVYVQRIHPMRDADRSALRLNYLDARAIIRAKAAYGRDMGMLPSNPLHDSYLRSGSSKSISYLYPAWAEDLIANPEKNKMFEKKDLKDERTGWILPLSYIPYEAFGRFRVGLHILPERFEGTVDGTVIVHPKADGITIIDGLIQVSGKWGKADEKTKVPVEVSDELFRSLSPDELACFFRESETAIRPIVRDDGHLVVVRSLKGNDEISAYAKFVMANFLPTSEFGVATVILEREAEGRSVSGAAALAVKK